MVAIYLLVIITLPVAIGLLVGYRSIPEGRDCPLCPSETLRLRARWLAWPSLLLRREIQRRWCIGCGWEGLARVQGSDRRSKSVPTDHPQEPAKRPVTAYDSEEEPRRAREAVDLRNINVEGEPWRVLLQCWHESGRWFGRLLFNSPSGRIWTDGNRQFHGDSLQELLQQALSLSDRALTARLREVVSD